ncbi:LuxR C-terminal-related transcriptional regulator [Solirubrobacter phytolaccae]|uniref:LuxR C-terminal-related transcriptional regulator n=1 Tax=Solirubrobacter phytolaccae TaxID=1404360 RepID=A0A9X3NEQ5_9ACTN|nr:LuxR family transcriptional regulator [Solirubrobacter phytolaccae]MDA0184784.1 LuxR C-terminal-related transcriptional regulator [Solirubrobacter phytolaccae]
MVDFVGREAELRALGAALAAACPRVLLVEGAAGAGKTALLDRFVAGATTRVVRVNGELSERAVALGVVDQLLRRAGSGSVLLDVLCAEPTVLVVDDAQWVDAESLDALVFALRRLVAEPVLTIVCARPGAPLAGLARLFDTRLALTPFTQAEVRALTGLPDGAARRLWEHTGGLPGPVTALAHAVPADPESPLPAPPATLAEAACALRACDADTRALVEAAAVLGSGCRLADAAALAHTEHEEGLSPSMFAGPAEQTETGAEPAGVAKTAAAKSKEGLSLFRNGDRALVALEAAAEAGLVVAGRARGLPVVVFDPPMVAAAVLAQVGPARVAALHRHAAARVEDEAVALHHLAAAAAGPDDALARRLDDFARHRRERPDAASALLAASRLSTTAAEREDRLLRAVDWMLLAGEVAWARVHAEDVARCAVSARRESILGQLAVAGDRVREAGDRLAVAWERCDPDLEPEVAATIAHRNAFLALVHLKDTEVADWAQRALRLAPHDRLSVEWTATLALALWRQGRREDAYATLERAMVKDRERDAQLTGMRAWLKMAGGDVGQRTRDDLAAAAETELKLGALEIGVVHLNVLVRAHFAAGAWDDATTVAERAIALGSELEDVSARVFVWWAAELVPGARGDWTTLDALAARAESEPTDAPDRVLAVGVARALKHHPRGDAPPVLEALEPVANLTPNGAIDEPGFWPWQHLYADALIACGRLADADRFLARHETLAAARDHHPATARLAISRGRLESANGDRDAAECAFTQAVELTEPLDRPYELAHARLALGQFLRRERRRRSAADLMLSARETFAALNAAPAVARCDRELGASGLRPYRREDVGALTPQEITVAELVASGHSNREVATDLQLSVKTVEVHLTRIYAKLGISSRGQLASRL